ncbi:MAG: hypothetical protein HZB43_02505, partial [candidate division Zixibacteria bacterium]|nr:hypothetical protein [candidate division Zixibacteria bacterium]
MITRKLRMWCPSSNRAEDIFRGAWVAIRALVAIGMLIPACGKTTKSQPVRYNIYIGGGYNPSVSPGYLYVIDADSLSVLDSIPGFPSVRNVLISPDGRSAFLGVSYRRAATYDLLKIDLRSKELVDRYPNSDCALHLSSADSGRLLVGGRYCNQVIDPRTFARLYTAPDSLDLWHGPEGGTQVAAMPRDMGTRVYGFDLRTGAVSGYYEPHLTSGD